MCSVAKACLAAAMHFGELEEWMDGAEQSAYECATIAYLAVLLFFPVFSILGARGVVRTHYCIGIASSLCFLSCNIAGISPPPPLLIVLLRSQW